MAMAGRHGGQGGNICHVHMAMSWRREKYERLEEEEVSFFIYF